MRLKNKILCYFMIFTLSFGLIIPPSDTVTVKAEMTVLVTRTGSCYHIRKCGNGTYYSATLSSAKARGLRACKKCFPNGAPSSGSNSGNGSGSHSKPKPHKTVVKKISISKSSLIIVKGTTASLKVKNASGRVNWKSSNNSVAKVKNGKVKGVGKGNATISVTANGQTKRCRVKVENVTISKKSIFLLAGKTTNIKVKGCSHSYKWRTTDSSVVKISSGGNVKATYEGSAYIKVKVHNKTFKCKVTVEDPYLEDYVDMGVDDTYYLEMEGCSHNVKWSSSNKDVVKVDSDGMLTAISEGEATITAKVHGKKYKCVIYVNGDEEEDSDENSESDYDDDYDGDDW